jgi:hypothetical protein
MDTVYEMPVHTDSLLPLIGMGVGSAVAGEMGGYILGDRSKKNEIYKKIESCIEHISKDMLSKINEVEGEEEEEKSVDVNYEWYKQMYIKVGLMKDNIDLLKSESEYDAHEKYVLEYLEERFKGLIINIKQLNP